MLRSLERTKTERRDDIQMTNIAIYADLSVTKELWLADLTLLSILLRRYCDNFVFKVLAALCLISVVT